MLFGAHCHKSVSLEDTFPKLVTTCEQGGVAEADVAFVRVLSASWRQALRPFGGIVPDGLLGRGPGVGRDPAGKSRARASACRGPCRAGREPGSARRRSRSWCPRSDQADAHLLSRQGV